MNYTYLMDMPLLVKIPFLGGVAVASNSRALSA